jgi:hypothetical protein
MTTYEDNLLAARFAALAPEPLAGDWADVVVRAGVPRKDRPVLRRSRWLGRRRLVVVLAVGAFVAVGAASAIGGVREFILDRGFIGLPPVGATPSTPENSELILHYLGRSASHGKGIGRPLVQVWVYADGRMIWSEESGHSAKPPPEGANELISGYLEQRLTPAGIELMRSQIAGLVDRSRSAVEALPTDYEPLGSRHYSGLALLIPEGVSGPPWGSVEVRDGDHFLGLQWLGGGDSGRHEGPIATPEQVAALWRIDALLTDRASVLPPSAWAERKIRAYVPSDYAACFFPPPTDQSQVLSLLPTEAAEVLRDKSPRRENVFGEYCFKVTTEEAREVAEALSGLDPVPAGARLAYQLAGMSDGDEGTQLWFEPYFPHGQITCSACG